jgi:hypothetical protein
MAPRVATAVPAATAACRAWLAAGDADDAAPARPPPTAAALARAEITRRRRIFVMAAPT